MTAGIRTAAQPAVAPAADPARNELVMAFLPLVRLIALRVARRFPSSLEVEDLVNAGSIALIEVLDRFDASRGVPLKAYAEVRIRGAMVDAIRKTDWVPRDVRRRSHHVEDARRVLRNRLGREPSREELAACLEVSPDQLDAIVGQTAPRRLVSLNAPTTADGRGTVADTIPDGNAPIVDRWIAEEGIVALGDAMADLPEDERQVMSMYYERGMKYREIGAVLGVCESRVCQLRTRALERLRKRVRLRGDGLVAAP